MILFDHGKLGDELGRVPPGEHPQRAEPGGGRPFEQLERSLRGRRDERSGARTERGRDRALGPGLDLKE